MWPPVCLLVQHFTKTANSTRHTQTADEILTEEPETQKVDNETKKWQQKFRRERKQEAVQVERVSCKDAMFHQCAPPLSFTI